MKAVNLIPADERRGAGGAAGRSGGGAYVLLAALGALLFVMIAVTTLGKRVDDRRDKLAMVTRDAAAAEKQAAILQSYTAFAALSQSRVAEVTRIADSRFDWSHVMHEVARTIPHGVVLSGIKGAVTPAATASGAAPTAAGPVITLRGCAVGDQSATARMMVSLRQIDGVQAVTLKSSVKPGAAGAVTSGPGATGCTGPSFEIDTTFATPTPAAAATDPAATAATTTTPTPGATQ